MVARGKPESIPDTIVKVINGQEDNSPTWIILNLLTMQEIGSGKGAPQEVRRQCGTGQTAIMYWRDKKESGTVGDRILIRWGGIQSS